MKQIILWIALAVVVLVFAFQPKSAQQKAQQQAQNEQEQMRAAAQEQWEKKNCVLIGANYLCRDQYGTVSPWSEFQAARSDLIK